VVEFSFCELLPFSVYKHRSIYSISLSQDDAQKSPQELGQSRSAQLDLKLGRF
jgi:hypothetical protein